MPRFARVVSPSHPHHVVHRGNRRQAIFLEEHDRADYLRLLGRYAARFGVRIWAYCLMPNHVHLIAVPAAPNSLAKGIGNAHWRFAQELNKRLRRTGHVWQNRYYSTPLDPHHLWAAVRYVERNPLRARLVRTAEEYPWSSARAHALGESLELLDADRPFVGASFDWSAWLNDTADGLEADLLRANTKTGRPTGAESFVRLLEARLNRSLRPRRRGRKPAPAGGPDTTFEGRPEIGIGAAASG
jgi:putative transposase